MSVERRNSREKLCYLVFSRVVEKSAKEETPTLSSFSCYAKCENNGIAHILMALFFLFFSLLCRRPIVATNFLLTFSRYLCSRFSSLSHSLSLFLASSLSLYRSFVSLNSTLCTFGFYEDNRQNNKIEKLLTLYNFTKHTKYLSSYFFGSSLSLMIFEVYVCVSLFFLFLSLPLFRCVYLDVIGFF